jgi:hypothetical protein
MKKITFISLLSLFTLIACGQKAQTFDKVVTFNAGFRFTSTGTIYTSLPSGGSMVYPSAGIPISTGTSWAGSITNNSQHWDLAYSWGNHAGLYRPVTWKPDYNTDILNVPADVQLVDAISSLPFFSPPKKTTSEISTLTPTEGDIVFDKTAKEWKGFINGVWVTFHTNQ